MKTHQTTSNLTDVDPPFQTVEALEEALSRPTDRVVRALANLEGRSEEHTSELQSH